jgi:HEAT repeat protein
VRTPMRGGMMTDGSRVWVTTVLLLVAVSADAQPAFQELLYDLQSPREATRVKAARAIALSGYPDAASALVPLLADRADAVQLEAIDALVGIALASAPGTNAANTFKRVRGSIAWSVFEAGPLAVLPRTWPPELLTSLAAALRDEDEAVRSAAAGALAVIGSPAVSAPAAETLKALSVDVIYALRSRDVHTREAVARAAGAIFTPPAGAAVPVAIGDALIAALNDAESPVRAAAADALGWVREVRAEQALRDRFAFFREGPEAESALHALARMASPASAGVFRRALTSREAGYRLIGAEALGRLRDRTVLPVLSAMAERERERSVLVATAFAFYLLGEHSNLQRLAEALLVPDVARQARAYLTELGATSAPELHSWLQQNDPALRKAVVEVLGLSGHAASEAALQQVARGDSDRAVAEAARQALLRLRALPQGARTR